jgi:hypothetical protein
MKMKMATLAAGLALLLGAGSAYALGGVNGTSLNLSGMNGTGLNMSGNNGTSLNLAGINGTSSGAASEHISINLNSVTVESVKLPD